ncbi:MAG: divalent-cation tolerance protein CutA [Candidatus Omnitrophica bacterium]|nr:divalent-cation tolerance protein CutA [Candidatus Omnitrophota bacterium]MBI2371405.1 divalent-cation tolerance protein CutA [Deltaproteobacteria bacterium]MBI3078254.1 divalent-cation tolerance protein CutA [Deltaproteobacteria bacterium]
MTTPYIVVLVTASSEEEGARIGQALVERRLAACVNLVPRVRSFYRWEGQLCDEAEVLLVIKTRQERFPALAAAVRALHSYTVPEVIAFALTEGSEPYLRWIDQECGPAPD